MSWPTSTDYNEAIQNPQVCFADPDLRAGQADGLMGLPSPFSGNFADVYKMMCAGGKNWAVKCFTREVQGLHDRYQAISDHLQERSKAFMVEFQYQDQGIKVKGSWYPVVKMSWVEGFALNQFVADHAAEAGLLERLADLWVKLAVQLREARMAHGDLQHGNVLLVPGSKANALALKLIDYDGMFVPTLADKPSGELGHRNYQHPKRKDADAYTPEMDRFAHLAIYTALRGVRAAGGLWSKYGDPENLLFRQNDFADPAGSALLKELWALPDRDARALSGHVVLASVGPLADVPLLGELVAGGAVRPLTPEEEARVESSLSARPTTARKSNFNPRAQQTPAAGEAKTVPPLPSPLQPGDTRRRTPFPVPPVPEAAALMQAVPVPPPLPGAVDVPPLPAPARAVRMPEMLPSPLPALRSAPGTRTLDRPPIPFKAEQPTSAAVPVPARETPRPAARKAAKVDLPEKDDDTDDDDDRAWHDKPELFWGVLGTAAVLIAGLLVWWLWPAKKPVNAGTPPPIAALQARIRSLEDVEVRGGDTKLARVGIERQGAAGPLVLKVEKPPAGVTCEPVAVEPERDDAQIAFRAARNIDNGHHRVVVSLWDGNKKTAEYPVTLSVYKRPLPEFLVPKLKPLVWKVNERSVVEFAVDRKDNPDELTLEFNMFPPAKVAFRMKPFVGGPAAADPAAPPAPEDGENPQPVQPNEPKPLPGFVSVEFTVAPDAAAPAGGLVKIKLLAAGDRADEVTLNYSVERSALTPRLTLVPSTLVLTPGAPAELQARVERQGYEGPISLRIDKLPDGVIYTPDAEIAAGKLLVPLEFRNVGTAAAGATTVEVSALVDGKEVDRKNLQLVIPKSAPKPPVEPMMEVKGQQTVTLRTADDVILHGTFYPGEEGKRSKCVLLLPEIGQTRREGNLTRLAKSLNAEGYAVLVIDFRGHGESTGVGKGFGDFAQNAGIRAPRRPGNPQEGPDGPVAAISFRTFPPVYYAHFVDDVMAAKAFLDEKDQKGQVDAANLVLVGVGEGMTVGSLWLAAEGMRHRPANRNQGGNAYETMPELHHVAGAIWLNPRLSLGGTDRSAVLATWLRSVVRDHQMPITFVYGRRDALAFRTTAALIKAVGAAARLAQGQDVAMPDAGALTGHSLLNRDFDTEKVVLKTVRQILDRPDGATRLPRSQNIQSFWMFGGVPLPAYQQGDPAFQPVPVERFGITR